MTKAPHGFFRSCLKVCHTPHTPTSC
jgi:hypothetical protein